MTPCEQTIVYWWGEQVPTEEIAAALGCSSAAIRDEIRRLRRKGVQIPLRERTHEPAQSDAPRVGTPYDQMMAGIWRAGEQEAMRP